MKDLNTRHTKLLKEVHKTKGHLEFFIDRSSETIERTLSIVQELQKEIHYLKDGLSRTKNQYQNKKTARPQPDVLKTPD